MADEKITNSIHRAELKGRDLIEVDLASSPPRLKVIGCADLLALVRAIQTQHGVQPGQWPLPKGTSHSELLVKELILRVQGKWKFPYEHLELCHCRRVETEVVDQAIIAGAHRPEEVSRQTSASTACGTCRPDVEKIIQFRLGSS
ncbi:MAG: nitrite reductase [Bdellovibrio sp. CG10_big_fil_rev_8_21_14_0_10_47_8]|nr:MAG: nitrite reductase [Bdellovibrio sp. CG10_big_fil_rev_8_21_14_0_10_47_8]